MLQALLLLTISILSTLFVLFKTPVAQWMGVQDEHKLPIVLAVSTITLLQFLISVGSSTTAVRTKSDLHLRRKIQHALSGVMICYTKQYLTSTQICTVLLCCSATFYLVHQIRQRHAGVNRVFMQLFQPILRPHEIHQLPGAFHFLNGCAACFALYPDPIAVLAILHLSFGDPMASLCGVLWSIKRFRGGKSLGGCLGCFVTCCLVAYYYYDYRTDDRWTLVVVHGIAGTLAEVADVGLDDNFTMPIFSGGILLVFLYMCDQGIVV